MRALRHVCIVLYVWHAKYDEHLIHRFFSLLARLSSTHITTYSRRPQTQSRDGALFVCVCVCAQLVRFNERLKASLRHILFGGSVRTQIRTHYAVLDLL